MKKVIWNTMTTQCGGTLDTLNLLINPRECIIVVDFFYFNQNK